VISGPPVQDFGPAPSQAPEASSHPPGPDCWNRIGVHGDGSCPELRQHVHCRNCSVYANAGRQLLDRPLPAGYRREWTEHFARVKPALAPARTSAVLFRIQTEWLALPTHVFQEVAEQRLVHSLPHRRLGPVLGLVNIRGELIICVALSRILGIETPAPRAGKRTIQDRLLVVNWEGHRLAFPVAEIHGIHRFQSHELKEPPATVARSSASFTEGVFLWEKRTVGFLAADRLFSRINGSLT
jgi:chemotaxis-related protein WspD